jgi:hypothetical protein
MYWVYGGHLNISFTPVPVSNDATKTYLNNWFTSNGWTVLVNIPEQGIWLKDQVMAAYSYDDDPAVLWVRP